jgi:hypothetical protein
MRDMTKFIVPPNTKGVYDNPAYEDFRQYVLSIAKNHGIEDVLLLNNEARFAGGFKTIKGKKTMLIKASLAQNVAQPDAERNLPIEDSATDTTIHELAHFEENIRQTAGLLDARTWARGMVFDVGEFTHDSVGPFADQMKVNSARMLFFHGKPDDYRTDQQSNLLQSPISTIAKTVKGKRLPTAIGDVVKLVVLTATLSLSGGNPTTPVSVTLP